MVTIKQISEKLHLSPATVSRALNGYPEVSARTRLLVEDTARRLNYRPNQLAKKLATGRSGMIGLVLPPSPDQSFDPTFYDVMTGLSRRLTELDLDLVFHAPVLEDEVEPFRRLVGKQAVDGFIVTNPKLSDPRIEFLRSDGVPFVVHGRDASPAPDYAFFDIDNFRVGYDAAKLLIDLGHRQLCFLNGPEDVHFSFERRRGFEQALRDFGSSPVFGTVRHGRMTETYGYMQALAALSEPENARPTGIACSSTIIAAGAMRAIRDKGLNIPADVSVIAHDDAPPQVHAMGFDPALTVTFSPLRDACRPLADILQGLLNGDNLAGLQVTEEAELIVRQSTGPSPLSKQVQGQTA
ncbi:MAG: substrate-binding domain-containing protein [Hyphomicrobiaceae bacterium]|nr:substrate-binding domain-containing protein [Hyphomicrobiaceae bacterium]